MPVPTPEEQIRFLANLQRILDEGIFTASYKFALLHALADLALEKGDDLGAPLEISTREIAATSTGARPTRSRAPRRWTVRS